MPKPRYEVSTARAKDEVDNCIEAFQDCIGRIDETTLRLEELTKLFRSGEISQAAFDTIQTDLGQRLFLSVQEAYTLRESLELERARAKLEWSKKRVGLPTRSVETEAPAADLRYVRGFKDVLESKYWSESGSGHMVDSLGLEQWEGLVSKIDNVLSSLDVEKEAAIIQQYLALLKDRPSAGTAHHESEEAVTMFQKRLRSVSERWASVRRQKVERMVAVELQASQAEDELKELEARFSVGQLRQQEYEYRVSGLKATITKLKKEISDIRSEIDQTDTRIFRASELLGEGS